MGIIDKLRSDLKDVPQDRGRWLIYGPQGTGKTTLAATIAETGKTLFLDMIGERGTRSIGGYPWSSNIDVIRPTSVTELDDIYYELAKGGHGYSAVVLDSLTSVQKLAMKYLMGYSETAVREIKLGSAPPKIQTWGQSLDIMVDTAVYWYGLADGDKPEPMHVVMTSQTKLIGSEEGDDSEMIKTIDVQKGAQSLVLAAPDYVVYCDTEANLEAESDESPDAVRHIVRFGAHVGYRTKGRVPNDLIGKIPSVLGRKNPTNLTTLSRVLRIGGVPPKSK